MFELVVCCCWSSAEVVERPDAQRLTLNGVWLDDSPPPLAGEAHARTELIFASACEAGLHTGLHTGPIGNKIQQNPQIAPNLVFCYTWPYGWIRRMENVPMDILRCQ